MSRKDLKMVRKSKTDHRQFSDICGRDNKAYFGEARYYKKKKPCILCGDLFIYLHGKQLYCEKCQKRK